MAATKSNVPDDVKQALEGPRRPLRVNPKKRTSLARDPKYLQLFGRLEVGWKKLGGAAAAPVAVALVDFSQLPASWLEREGYQPKALAELFTLLESTFKSCKIKVTTYKVVGGYFEWSLARAEVAKLERLVEVHRAFIADSRPFLGDVPSPWKVWADASMKAFDAVMSTRKPKATTAKKAVPSPSPSPAPAPKPKPKPNAKAVKRASNEPIGDLPKELVTSFFDFSGWWLRREGDRLPYRASSKGVSFVNPAEVIGLDLRTVADPKAHSITRPPFFVLDGAATNGRLREIANRCDACKSHALSLFQGNDDVHVLCHGCGGMFDHETFAKMSKPHLTVEWAARLEGKWRPGDEAVLAEMAPAMLSATGAQACAAARRIASALSLRAFAVGESADDALAALGAQKRLRTLRLWHSGLTDRGLAGLEQYPTLTHVNLGNNAGITDAGVAAVVGKLRGLASLELEQTLVGDLTLAAIAKLPALERLVLNSTRVTDAGLAALRQHPSLREVAVGYTKKVTNAGLKHLATAPHITAVSSFGSTNAAKNGPLAPSELRGL